MASTGSLEENFSSRTAEDQWETAVDLFHERPVLLIWDNFESTLPIYQNRDDLPAESGSEKSGDASYRRVDYLKIGVCSVQDFEVEIGGMDYEEIAGYQPSPLAP